MPLTPADVHNVAFSKPPIGKRGYNEDEVDQFLDLVEDTLAQLQDENDDLRARVEELGSGSGAPAAAAAGAPSTNQVDERAIREEIEDKLRKEYEARLKDAEDEAKAARSRAEAAFVVTDPPINLLRRYIPPLPLGGVALDVSVIVLFLALVVLQALIRGIFL